MGFSPSESGRLEKASSQFVWEPADYQLEKCFWHNREVKSNYPSGATKILTWICQHGTGPVCSLFNIAGKWTQNQSFGRPLNKSLLGRVTFWITPPGLLQFHWDRGEPGGLRYINLFQGLWMSKSLSSPACVFRRSSPTTESLKQATLTYANAPVIWAPGVSNFTVRQCSVRHVLRGKNSDWTTPPSKHQVKYIK